MQFLPDDVWNSSTLSICDGTYLKYWKETSQESNWNLHINWSKISTMPVFLPSFYCSTISKCAFSCLHLISRIPSPNLLSTLFSPLRCNLKYTYLITLQLSYAIYPKSEETTPFLFSWDVAWLAEYSSILSIFSPLRMWFICKILFARGDLQGLGTFRNMVSLGRWSCLVWNKGNWG